jgi:hypothetical protein
MVFHRILDFKTRLDVYPASLFTPTPKELFIFIFYESSQFDNTITV